MPKTWTELKAACDKIKAKAGNEKLDCYAGQHDKYEGGTVNFAETVNSAGGVIIGPDGKPNVNTPEAKKGLDRLQAWFKDGTIPEGALTWKEENGRQAFQAGTLIFHRNWGYVYARATNDASSKIKGKFDVAALPGEDGPGVSSLGGHNLAIAKYGKNKGTAVEFAKWWSSEEEMKQNALVDSSSPTIAKLYKTRSSWPSSRTTPSSSSRSRMRSPGPRRSSTVTSPWPSRTLCTPSSRAAILKAHSPSCRPSLRL